MKKLLLVVSLFASAASADPMRFENVRNGGNCAGCSYIQATGEITSQTPKDFEAYLRSQNLSSGTVRLNSPGGSLVGGIVLGELLRGRGFATEVGASRPILGAVEAGLFDRAAGVCASACAYAFLGGEERSLDKDAKLGFHRFYRENALTSSSQKLFTGQDLDDAQRVTAALALYVIKMGVDARLVTLAAEAGPNEMRWLPLDEARELRVAYQPWSYKPWRVEAHRGGAVAITESSDGVKSIVASCSKRLGSNVTLINSKPTWDVASWFDQCRDLQGGHPVFGTRVDSSRVQVIRRNDGGAMIRFQLPTNNPPLTSAALLTFQEGYPRACSTNEYEGSRENFVAAVRLALRNCFQD